MKKNILKTTTVILLTVSMFCINCSFADNNSEDKPINSVYEDIRGVTSTDSIINFEKQEKEQKSEVKKDMKPKLETVNNYFIGTFRLYDKDNGKIYDFQANKAFTYDYKKAVPPLKTDRVSLNIFINQIEDYFNDKNLSEILYPIQIANSNKYNIVKQKMGLKKIDRAKFENELSRRIRIADYSLVEIPFTNNFKQESIAVKNEVILLSSYTTKYNSYDTGRTSNVVMAGEEINGTKLAPNEKFYYNSRISGIYPKLKTAKVIVNNEFVDGVGGGLCQVSTTLFNTVLESGLQIDHRRAHSLPINYVPRGRDAMVSDYNDFVFTNNFKNDIYITYERTAVDEITFKIYGSKEDKKNINIWVSGSGLRYVLHRTVDKSTAVEKFYSNYSTPKP